MAQWSIPATAAKALRFFRTRRSGGVRVSWRIGRLIRAADEARDRGKWEEAARLYGKILRLAPKLVNVRVQHGHALKESGHLLLAHEAYRQAAALAPDRRDPRLHLGHAAKLIGAYDEAAESYLTLLLRDPADAEAATELSRSLSQLEHAARDRLLHRLRDALPPELMSELTPSAGAARAVLAFDLSDLVSFFAHARRPTGIQRVQIETVSAVISARPPAHMRVAICCMPHGIDEWRELPLPLFHTLAQLSRSIEGEEAWPIACSRMNLALLLGSPIRIEPGSCLVNLGASWSLGNYFLALRQAKANHGLSYIPFIHDLIPIVRPQFHSSELIREFSTWLQGALAHADHFLTNSLSTTSDLHLVSRDWGEVSLHQRVTVVRLDAHIDVPRRIPAPGSLPAEPFALFVGTIEPRKGHVIAFDAWTALLQDGGRVPRLVCVSGKGWENNAAFARLRTDSRLAERVIILSNVDDPTLNELYRRAVFTIYPSLYEGWGLPVTEALARGKITVTTLASALPEAGGALALYVEPGDSRGLADTVRRLIDDPDGRAALEKRIAREFVPRSWTDVALQIMDVASLVAQQPRLPVPPRATIPNRFYRLARSAGPHVAGEQMRVGSGWFWPQEWGNRVRTGGACLCFSVHGYDEGPKDRLVVALLLRGTDTGRCGFSVRVNLRPARTGWLKAGGRRWVFGRVLPDRAKQITITIAGEKETVDDLWFPDAVSHLATVDGNTIGIEGWVTIPASSLNGMRSTLRGILLGEPALEDGQGATLAPHP